MQQLFANRWFALVEFITIIILSALIVAQPQMGRWIVILSLIPWLARLILKRFTFEKTPFILPILIFLVTALVGYYVAYDPPASAEKLWVILVAFALFVSLVNQPRENLGVVASLVGLMGVIITVVFIISNDWQAQSSDLVLIQMAGDWILATFPQAIPSVITPNFAGGLLAILVPISIASGIYYWQNRNRLQFALTLGMVMIILGGLFLTSSRGAWIALISGIGLWLLWQFSKFLANKANKTPLLIFGLLLLITILPSLWIVSIMPGGFVGMAARLPGLPTGESRYELAINTGKLIADYPFTGGGLRSFPGQYSQYMLVIPHFLFPYSHNFYLDVSFEQGIIGALAIFGLIIGATYKLMTIDVSQDKGSLTSFLSGAILISTCIILLHGLIDDPLYGDTGSPLLLLIPGFSILLYQYHSPVEHKIHVSNTLDENPWKLYKLARFAGMVGFVILVGYYLQKNPLLASWYANIGAIDMAKRDLVDWPSGEWKSNPDVSELVSAQILFEEAIARQRNQRTAWHRLGLISAQSRNFDQAQDALLEAYKIDPNHRGIRKSLGYVYAWNGELDQAAGVLEGIEEARDEMDVYSWWWQENDQPILANFAGNLARLLKPELSTP
jgi:O-antigen ligase